MIECLDCLEQSKGKFFRLSFLLFLEMNRESITQICFFVDDGAHIQLVYNKSEVGTPSKRPSTSQLRAIFVPFL